MESAMIASEDKPLMEESLKSDERLSWSDMIKVGLFQIEKLHTWDLVVPPPGTNIIPSCYVFCWKHDDKGKIVTYKAWLVAKGFKQQYSVDYTDTFTLTVHLWSLWPSEHVNTLNKQYNSVGFVVGKKVSQ